MSKLCRDYAIVSEFRIILVPYEPASTNWGVNDGIAASARVSVIFEDGQESRCRSPGDK